MNASDVLKQVHKDDRSNSSKCYTSIEISYMINSFWSYFLRIGQLGILASCRNINIKLCPII